MVDRVRESGRKAWSKPEVRRIDAGSAETGTATKNDGAQSSQKS